MGTSESKSQQEVTNGNATTAVQQQTTASPPTINKSPSTSSLPSSSSTSNLLPIKLPQSKLLSEEDVAKLRNLLPGNLKSHNEWKLLYSSVHHGFSIRSFRDRVQYRGPTIMVLRDSFGAIFGGFGSHEWYKSNQFYGDSSCFLFSIKPEFHVYPATNMNNNFMYFNEGNEFNEYNGLALGGRMGFFSLSLDKSFNRGTSRPGLMTYSSPCLCTDTNELEENLDDIDQYHFIVDTIECWGFPLTESQQLDLEFKTNQKNARVAALKGDDADYFIMQQVGLVGAGENYRDEKNEKPAE